MSYGQQPDPHGGQPSGVPPVPQAPGTPYGAQPSDGEQTYGYQQGYTDQGSGAPQSYGTPQTYGAPQSYGQYGAPAVPGSPWQGPGIATRRPGTVTAGAVLAFIGGGLMVLLGVLIAILGAALADDLISGYGLQAAAALGLVLAGVGALIVFLGAMAFKGRYWAAIVLAVLAGLAIVGVIADMVAGSGSSLVGAAWSLVSAVLLLLPASRAWYRSQR